MIYDEIQISNENDEMENCATKIEFIAVMLFDSLMWKLVNIDVQTNFHLLMHYSL